MTFALQGLGSEQVDLGAAGAELLTAGQQLARSQGGVATQVDLGQHAQRESVVPDHAHGRLERPFDLRPRGQAFARAAQRCGDSGARLGRRGFDQPGEPGQASGRGRVRIALAPHELFADPEGISEALGVTELQALQLGHGGVSVL